jgi:hypothetical protein
VPQRNDAMCQQETHAPQQIRRGRLVSWRVDYLWFVRGNTILNSVKSPGSVSTSMLPPCCFTMMSWLIDRAKTGAFARGLGCEKRIEYLLFDLVRDTSSVIANSDFDSFAVIFRGGDQHGFKGLSRYQ